MHLPPQSYKEKEYHNRIRKVLAFIQENLASDIPLSRMAEVANFSPFHFQKLFTQQIGESPKKYVLRLRIERMAHILKLYPELSVFELSLQSGFASSSTFGRAFKKYYGISPDEFRKLPPSEISKICTSVNNKGIEVINNSNDFWNVNYDDPGEDAGTAQGQLTVIKQRSLKVIFIDTHLGAETAISDAFKALHIIVNPRELLTPETRYIGIFLDLPFFTELSKCRFRACISLTDTVQIPKGVSVYTIPENRFAVFSALGNLTETLKRLVAFKHGMLDGSGYKIAETIGYEEYPVNPALEDYAPFERKVYVPVKPA
jgi:AraC family transcriptional regulator